MIFYNLSIAGVMNGNLAIWYFAVPLTYLEAGLSFSPSSLYEALSNGYLQIFVICFVYILMPLMIRVGTCLLTYAGVNIWLLKGMEVIKKHANNCPMLCISSHIASRNDLRVNRTIFNLN